jgi:hypothetical protein
MAKTPSSNQCASCGYVNRVGVWLCEDCGAPLLKEIASLTTRIKKAPVAPTGRQTEASSGTASFDQDCSLVIRIQTGTKPVVVKIPERVILGRLDPARPLKPDIDLTDFGAVENGISRIHASIQRQNNTLLLRDIRSTNGTYLNGERLKPDDPQLLRDGDEVRLGELVAHVYFK